MKHDVICCILCTYNRMQLYSIAIKIFREQQDEDNALDRMALFFSIK